MSDIKELARDLEMAGHRLWLYAEHGSACPCERGPKDSPPGPAPEKECNCGLYIDLTKWDRARKRLLDALGATP